VLDNFSTGKRENIEGLLGAIDLMEGDIRDAAMADAACEGVDFVFHQAALPSVPRSIEDPVGSSDINILGTLRILEAARKARVKRVVYASSSSVYGDSPVLPKTEDMLPNPLSPYAAQKLAGEHFCRMYAAIFGLETVSLRYFNVFGPKQDPASHYAAVIPKFITALLRSQPPTVFGDGLQSRDFTYIRNVVEANLCAALAPNPGGEVFNVACGVRISLNELLAVLRELLGSDIQAIYTDPRPGDVKHSLADIGKAGEYLAYETKVSFQDGLSKSIAWYRASLSCF
jgi:UDP-glucose 4-epimerase